MTPKEAYFHFLLGNPTTSEDDRRNVFNVYYHELSEAERDVKFIEVTREFIELHGSSIQTIIEEVILQPEYKEASQLTLSISDRINSHTMSTDTKLIGPDNV
jgi:hypothetical protein